MVNTSTPSPEYLAHVMELANKYDELSPIKGFDPDLTLTIPEEVMREIINRPPRRWHVRKTDKPTK